MKVEQAVAATFACAAALFGGLAIWLATSTSYYFVSAVSGAVGMLLSILSLVICINTWVGECFARIENMHKNCSRKTNKE